MKIYSIAIENFKAVEKFAIIANGANVEILGENGTKKSTMADAFMWCLTGRFFDGSIGEVNFYSDGKILRDRKIHAVEIELDDKTTIRRELVNTFDKSGNFKSTTQNFFIDGVELKQKEFDAEIQKITGGAPLNPFGFCQMAWKERRNILMKMCPVDNAAVIASNLEFQQLNLKNNSPEMIITMKKNEIKKLSAEVDGIPARIDELSNKKFSIEGNEDELKAEIEKAKLQLKESAARVTEIQKQISERDKPKAELLQLRQRIFGLESEIEREKINLERADEKLAEMREEFKKIYVSKGEKCPTCGQKLPAEIQNKKLSEIEIQGKKLRAERYKKSVEISAKVEELKRLKNQAEEIERGMTADSTLADELNAAISERDKIILASTDANNKLARFLQNKNDAEQTQQRIEFLKKRESEVNQQIADCQSQINLAEKFIRAKVKLIEDTVNSKFDFVRFKLFETLINGSVKEICEPMIDGVPYNDGLNKGAKLKAALDILKTLQKFYSIELPIFIDDAESYTSNSFVDLPNQLFLLKAVEGQKKLRVEIAEEKFELRMKEGKAA